MAFPETFPDPEDICQLLRDAAAAEVLPRYRKLASGDISEKSGPSDLVTTADLETELYLTSHLNALTPEVQVIGEEAVEDDPRLMRYLAGDDMAWVIDPVDGTLNFTEGRPEFAIILSFVSGGQVRAGWILDPLLDEVIWAVEGEGAWRASASGARERLSVAERLPVAAMQGALYTGPRRSPDLSNRVKKIRKQFGKLTYFRSVGHEYLALARGDNHYALFTRLMPWDHAAGVLIHRECGGFSQRLDGQPYSPAEHRGFLLLAPDEATWSELRDMLLADGAAPAPV